MTIRAKTLRNMICIALILLSAGCAKKSANESATATDTVAVVTTQDDAPQNYFYSNGKKVMFTMEDEKIPVRFKSEAAFKNYAKIQRDLKVDDAYNFQGIEILSADDLTITRQDSMSLQNFVDREDDLVSLIRLSAGDANLILTNKVVARFKEGTTEAEIDSVLAESGCIVIEKSQVREGRVILECPDNRVTRSANALFESDLVEYAHPDFISEVEIRSDDFPNDPLFNDQWHLHNTGQSNGKRGADISAMKAWEITKGSPDVIIAIIDDAFDVKHEDLAGNLHSEMDFTANPPDADASPGNRDESHGTSVAGVAVAQGDNNIGGSGSCPNCRFIAIRALGGPVSTQARAFDAAVASGAWIISNSWGYPVNGHLTDDVVDAINNAATNGRNGKGCVILFAMTNTNIDNCDPQNADISSLESVIAVSRSTNLDVLGKGGYGSCMEVVAPTKGGTLGITTTDITGIRGYSQTDYYSGFGGTSAATPLVAGIAGLMLSINRNLTREDVRTILTSTAVKIDSANARYDDKGFSQTHGYGRVNAYEAVRSAMEDSPNL